MPLIVSYSSRLAYLPLRFASLLSDDQFAQMGLHERRIVLGRNQETGPLGVKRTEEDRAATFREDGAVPEKRASPTQPGGRI